ncbi:MAG: CpaF family protein, partial [Actinobacteria bacterium]|nr:CpaF family protein [Actinomycetota bacterium]
MKNSTLQSAIGSGAPEKFDLEELKELVHKRLLNRLGAQLYLGELDAAQLEELVYESISEEIDASDRSISTLTRANLVQEVVDEVLGIGPIQSLLRNPKVTEIMVNRFDSVYYEEEG